MSNIGFYGGSSIVELGSSSEMSDFLARLRDFASNDKELMVINELYYKYVPLNKLDELKNLIERVINNLSGTEKSEYFDGLMHCIESAQGFYEDWGIYKPVKVVKTGLPDFFEDRDRPQEEYDRLKPNELPFWQR